MHFPPRQFDVETYELVSWRRTEQFNICDHKAHSEFIFYLASNVYQRKMFVDANKMNCRICCEVTQDSLHFDL